MKLQRLGRTGLQISQLALGTMPFGGAADEETAAAIFRASREAGINFFDCADVYAGGQAETILGELTEGCRDEVVIASKVYFPTGPGPNDRGASRYHVVRSVERSLQRLRTDRLDVLFLHHVDEHTALDETLRGLETLVQQGKLLYPAVSNFAAWQTVRCLSIAERHGWAPVVCVQPMYNLVKRQAEVEILPMAQAEGLGVLPYSPLGGGLLTGRYGVEKRPERGRLVDSALYRARYSAPSNYEIAERFCALSRAHGHHPAALAIAWAASHPAVTAPLIGPRTPEHLAVCLQAIDIAIDPALRQAISDLSPAPPPPTDRSEQGGGAAAPPS